MPEITTYPEGNFCWAELVTSDPAASKAFYTALFGWTVTDTPMGPDEFYTMLSLNGKTACALYGMNKEQLARGVRPHWNYYIAADSVDEMTKKAESLGAKVVQAPFDVMDVGRMSTIQDVAGAALMFWQAKHHIGASVVDEPGAFCWYELSAHDMDAANKFYRALLGWIGGVSPEYTEWKNGDRTIAGMMRIKNPPGAPPMSPNWMGYVRVADCDVAVQRAKALGATLLVGPMDVMDIGRFAVILDPQGATIGLYRSLRT